MEDLEAGVNIDESGGAKDAYSATIEDRHRVYGQNVLPSRKTKSLLQLMWLALKDKVLVRTTLLLPNTRLWVFIILISPV